MYDFGIWAWTLTRMRSCLCSVTSKYWLVWKYRTYPNETWVRISLKLCNFLSSALLLHPLVSILVSLQVSYCSLSLGTSPTIETVIWFLDFRAGVMLTKWVECAGIFIVSCRWGFTTVNSCWGKQDSMFRMIWKSMVLNTFQDGLITVTYKSSI